jgi:hypothetical protein
MNSTQVLKRPIGFDPVALMAGALEHGLAFRVKQPETKSTPKHLTSTKMWRAYNVAMGLTARGTPRKKYIFRPELAQYRNNRTLYHFHYMRLIRHQPSTDPKLI